MVAPVRQVNNSDFEARGKGASIPSEEESLGFDTSKARQDGIDMAKATDPSSKSATANQVKESSDEGVLKTANSLFNSVKKLGSKALNALGFVGATSTAVLYFFFNSKIFSMITAIPTIMSFGLAYGLKKSVREDNGSTGLFDNPSDILSKARNDSSFLEQNFLKVIEATVDIADLKSDDPRKHQALEDLKQIADKVRVKKYEIETTDPNDQSNYEVFDIDRFLDIYEKMRSNDDLNQAAEEALMSDALSN